MMMTLCATCNKPSRIIQDRVPREYVADDGVLVLDQGLLGICACDPRYYTTEKTW